MEGGVSGKPAVPPAPSLEVEGIVWGILCVLLGHLENGWPTILVCPGLRDVLAGVWSALKLEKPQVNLMTKPVNTLILLQESLFPAHIFAK